MKHIIDDADKNKYEALSKAEVIALLQQVIESGELPEGELNGLVLALRNPIDNNDYRIAFCTQAKYNELQAAGQLQENTYYIITDDQSYNDLVSAIERLINQNRNLQTQIENNKNDIDNLKSQHLYEHSLTLRFDTENAKDALIFIRFLNNTNETLTVSKIKELITDIRYSCTGSVRNTDAYAINNIEFNTLLNVYIVQYSHTYTDSDARFNNDFIIVNTSTRQVL